MPAPQYQSGENVRVIVGEVEYPVESVKWGEQGPTHDHSNGRDGRVRVRGMADHKGQFVMPFDPATVRLRRGQAASLKVYISPTIFDLIPVIVTAVDYTGSLDDGYKATADFEQTGGAADLADGLVPDGGTLVEGLTVMLGGGSYVMSDGTTVSTSGGSVDLPSDGDTYVWVDGSGSIQSGA